MKTRTKIIAALAICMMAAGARAQENGTLANPDIPKNELKVSVGMGAQFASTGIPISIALRGGLWELATKGYSLSMSYKNNITHSSSLVYTCSYMTTFDFPDNGKNFSFLALQLGYQYTYKRYKNFSLYFGGHIGYALSFEKTTCWKNAQFGIRDYISKRYTLLGISMGKNHCADIELGLGTQGLLNIGYSRRF